MSMNKPPPGTRPKPVSPVDRMFRAFADRTRLRILVLLQDGELCVSDLMTILRVPQAKASHHLNYLRRAGLVEARKEGLWSFYRLRPAETSFHEKLLECLGQCFSGVPGLAADLKRASRLKASGGCCPKHPVSDGPVAGEPSGAPDPGRGDRLGQQTASSTSGRCCGSTTRVGRRRSAAWRDSR